MRSMMGMGRLLALVLLASAIGGNGEDRAPGRGEPAERPLFQLKVRQEFKGQHSGFRKAAHLVVKDAKEWQRLWALCTANQEPKPPLPRVDFTKEMVLAALMGEQRTGGYAIEIVQVRQQKKQIVVTVRRQTPPKDALTTMALTQPYHLLVVERSDRPVRFEVRETSGKAERKKP